jgi:hypothetical protein
MAKEGDQRELDSKPTEVAEDEETVVRTTFHGAHWKVTLNDKALEKYSAMKPEERYVFLLPKMRLDSKKALPEKDALGASLSHDLRDIRRFLDNGRLAGSRGKTVDASI